PAFDLNTDAVKPYPCVVLLNVSTLPAEAIKALQDHVRRGGGVWIIAGDKTDPKSFNASLFADGRGLSPVALGDITGDPRQRERFDRLRPPPVNHPATRLLADLDRLDVNDVRVFARFRFSNLNEQQRSSALLATNQGEPIAIDKQIGRGRVIVQAMPVDMSWSNLPICQAFVVMVHEWLWYLAEPMQTRWNLTGGDTFAASFVPDEYGPIAEVATPGGERIKVASTDRDGRRWFRCGKTLWPGAYQLVLSEPQGGERAIPFQVNRDPKESELTGLTETDVRALAEHGGLRFDGDPLGTKSPGRPGPPEPMWMWLMIAALAVLLAESALGAYLARRRAATPVDMASDSTTTVTTAAAA
ncbi:MAG: hypothetical protein HY718_06430, partial [Planctomycetes bacterium]|nr:hypothetical protein [Planctomycetota bacterium]